MSECYLKGDLTHLNSKSRKQLYPFAVREGILLVHIPRARERIWYERYLSMLSEEKPLTQQTLFPRNINLQSEDYLTITEHLEELSKIGFDIRDFGSNSVAIWSAFGLFDGRRRYSALIDALVASLKEQTFSADFAEYGEDLARKMAISAAKSHTGPYQMFRHKYWWMNYSTAMTERHRTGVNVCLLLQLKIWRNIYESRIQPPRFWGMMSPVIKNLIIINTIMLIATWFIGDTMYEKLALFPFESHFQALPADYAYVMHGNFWHLFFNMYTLMIFGTVLERIWGVKSFYFSIL